MHAAKQEKIFLHLPSRPFPTYLRNAPKKANWVKKISSLKKLFVILFTNDKFSVLMFGQLHSYFVKLVVSIAKYQRDSQYDAQFADLYQSAIFRIQK